MHVHHLCSLDLVDIRSCDQNQSLQSKFDARASSMLPDESTFDARAPKGSMCRKCSNLFNLEWGALMMHVLQLEQVCALTGARAPFW